MYDKERIQITVDDCKRIFTYIVDDLDCFEDLDIAIESDCLVLPDVNLKLSCINGGEVLYWNDYSTTMAVTLCDVNTNRFYRFVYDEPFSNGVDVDEEFLHTRYLERVYPVSKISYMPFEEAGFNET